MYWWQTLNPLKRLGMKGQSILKVNGEGCQSMNSFEWIGKIKGFQRNEKMNCEEIVIEVVIYNNSYSDARSNKEEDIYTYPLVNADIQNVKGVWILFT